MKHSFQFDPLPGSFCPFPPSLRESKSNHTLVSGPPSLPSGPLPIFVRCPEDLSHRRYKSRSQYITNSILSISFPLLASSYIFVSPNTLRASFMQQYNLRPVSELSRSPSSRSSGSPPNHNMSPPSSHLPPIQHSSNGAQAPIRRPISPSSLPRMYFPLLFHPLSSFTPIPWEPVRPRRIEWSNHASKKLPPTSHRS
jgi:hypothetical protein